jgi:flavorubredoxin
LIQNSRREEAPLVKVFVTYESKYGNTKLVAETIIEGMREIPGVETALRELKEVDLNKLIEYNVILIGTPNHMGSATRGIRKFIDMLGKLDLEGKMVAVFDTYMGNDFEKAVKKMEKQISAKVPGLKLATPSLSIRVEGTKGPITEGELPKCKEFGVRIATQLRDTS